MRNIFSSTSTSPTSSHHSSTSTPPHTLSSSIMEEKMESAESLITKWDISESVSSYTKIASLFTGDRTDSVEFLRSVEDLQSTMKHFVSQKSGSTELLRCQNLMQIAIKRLEAEFYQILSANRNIIDSESVSSRSSRASTRLSVSDNDDDEIVESSDDEKSVDTFMSDLKSIADCMIATGYGKECVKLYKLVRKSVVDETLYHIGVDNLSLSQVQKMEWDVMELKIKQWVEAIKVAIKKLLIGERILCDQVFAGSDRIREACFSEISVNGGLMLFLFPENVAKCKKSPEKMFRLLDLYTVISDNLQEIESIFSFESTSTVRSQALASLIRLGEAVRSTLSEFEAAIQKEVSKSVLPGGGVHPLTRYVMNYFVFLSDYSGALADILEDHPHTMAQASLPESYFSSTSPGDGSSSEISLRFAWIILVLLCKLDGKSQMYKDVSMSYLFLTNNLNYVVSKVQSSPLNVILGNDWVTNHDTKVRQYAANFERMGWAKVVAMLPNDPTAEISINTAKACFDKFNADFEETYRKHSSWVVTDPELRDEIKVSIVNRVVPVYTKFYEQNRGYFRREVGVEPIVKYTPADLENYFDDLYCGSGSGSRTSHSSAESFPSRDKKGSWH